ncbi:hypothetical protein PCC8801_3621 [Rippkaea orientalis PCC 8801]|uniref:Magnetosome protein MamS/MamX domain-containing protein n=1 Tax=Rippkaea orientalis (strain PCC 8801 / RF-1) TaxID=41431 RepID=B7K1P1_RIPO1|nr:hypothetical protein [Rippkaea orientalis]ACK67583.1 hypothetical protein PCC8801_3621 [Rippkaea orientalis PCC 8801]
MKINLANKTVQSVALAGITLLTLSSIPLMAQNASPKPISQSNVIPCWNTPANSQTYQQHHQWMAQQGGMMGTGWHGSGGWGSHSQYGRMYNLKSVTTVRGEVVKVDNFTPTNGMSGGMHLTLRTKDNQTLDVHLGPTWYLQNQDVQIQPKDTIEVTGSNVNFAGKPAIMAASVKKGNMTLILRDNNGVPMWHGWRTNPVNP